MAELPRRRLGTQGLTAGAVAWGPMGSRASPSPDDRAEARRVLDRAVDLGVTLFDTADVYGPYVSEEIVGEALRGRRDRVGIAPKFGNALDRSTPGYRRYDGRPGYVRRAAEASLARL